MEKNGLNKELLNFESKEILKAVELGVWVIRIDADNDRYEMYADDIMYRIMEADETLSPQECYQHWYSRISPGYYNYVNRSVQSMIQSGRTVQLQYTWTHPSQGDVQVRCVGVRQEDSDGMICLVGYHRLISSIDRPDFLEDAPSSEMFEFNERKNTIYFHTSRVLLAGEEQHENDFPIKWLREKIVHPHFAYDFREIFSNIQNKKDVSEKELMLKSKSGEYSWFKLTTRHLSEEESDRDTVLVQLRAADHERIAELENQRIRDFYHASLSESIAYAELDIESNRLQAAGGMWKECIHRYHGQGLEFLQYLVDCQHQYHSRKSTEKFVVCDSASDMWHAMQKQDGTIRYTYKRLINEEWRWVELIIYTFQESFTRNRYALLYLKDIDAEKKQQQVAQTDDLTGVYNRKAFEERVRRHMKEGSDRLGGSVILLDMDNFKAVNDQYGHLAGDEVLKAMAESMEAVFSKCGIVGRFGGDEFFVFIEEDFSKEQITQYLQEFIETFRNRTDISVSCSAGIAYIKDGAPSYQKIFSLADEALYASKQNGKNQYHFAR